MGLKNSSAENYFLLSSNLLKLTFVKNVGTTVLLPQLLVLCGAKMYILTQIDSLIYVWPFRVFFIGSGKSSEWKMVLVKVNLNIKKKSI